MNIAPFFPRQSHCRSARGFTLIEVILAIAVLALGMTVLTAAFVNILQSLDTLRVEKDRQGVLRFIRSQVLREPDRKKFEKGGEIQTLDLGKARWEAEVEETTVADLFSVKLQIELSPPDTKEVERYEMRLYLLRPTWSDPSDRSQIIEKRREQLAEERLHRG